MGGACTTFHRNKNTNIDPRARKNICSNSISSDVNQLVPYEYLNPENICDISNIVGRNDTGKYCLYIGSYNNDGLEAEDYEWLPWGQDTGGITDLEGMTSCDYWDGGAPLHKSTDSAGCCDGDCAITGGEYVTHCARTAFNAYPPLCCFNDLTCSNQEDQEACFDTPLRERTCDPKYRNLAGLDCQSQIQDYCTGDNFFPQGNVNWKDLWTNEVKINVMTLLVDAPYAGKYNDFLPPLIPKITDLADKGSEFSDVGDDNPFDKYAIGLQNSFTKRTPTGEQINIRAFGGFLQAFGTWNGTSFPEVSDVNRDSLEKRIKEFAVIKPQPCFNAVLRQSSNLNICNIKDITSAGLVPGTINQEGYNWSVDIVDKVFNKYFQEIGGVDDFFSLDEEALGKSPAFEEALYDLCKVAPALCINSLEKLCENVTAADLENISTGELRKKWCGCYMKTSQYNTTDLGGIVPRQCNQFCNNSQSIPYLDKNFNKLQCLENVCSITNDTVNLNRSEGASIEFGQVCPGCGNTKVNYSYTTQNFALNKLTTNIIGTQLKNTSGGIIESGNYFITLLTSDTQILPTSEEYVENPLCEISLDSSGKITAFNIISKGSESFSNDKIPDTGAPVNLYFKSCFIKNIDPIKPNIVTELENRIILNFTTIEYAKRVIKGNPVTKVEHSGYCKSIDLGKLGTACDWTPTFIVNESQQDSQNYHDKSIDQTSQNRCTCRIIGTNINEISDSLTNINLTQNCGNIECYDTSGNQIACSQNQEEPKLPPLTEVIQKEVNQEVNERYEKLSRFLIGAVIFICIYLIISKIYESLIKRRK